MSVLDRNALQASPLADLHAVASELSIDGYRRLRRAELIAAILDKQGGASSSAEPEASESKPAPARRSRRAAKPEPKEEVEAEADEDGGEEASGEDSEPTAARRRRGRRTGRPRAADRLEAGADAERASQSDDGPSEEPTVEGVVELLGGGSGFVRVSGPDPSDDDVYISAAQVKRCELVSGDRVAGPKRAPRRSERFASLIRIETINGRPASELADSVRFDDLPAAFPEDQLELDPSDPTLKAIDELTPFGKGSRVSIVGPAWAGKSEALRRIAQALEGREELSVQVVLAGARPEEISEWSRGAHAPAALIGLGGSEEAQNSSVETVVDQARRLAARGADAVVLIDSLDGCSAPVARKALAAARNIVDGGSLTVVAVASAPLGGETTVMAFDAARAGAGKFPALDLAVSGVLRPELLVGAAGAKAIARARADTAASEE